MTGLEKILSRPTISSLITIVIICSGIIGSIVGIGSGKSACSVIGSRRVDLPHEIFHFLFFGVELEESTLRISICSGYIVVS